MFLPVAIPLAGIYAVVTRIRNLLFDIGVFRATEFDVPIILVGNLSVGGTGKTPLVEYLLKLFSPTHTVAVLSRGYGRKTKGFLKVSEDSSAAEVGDEPLLLKKKFPNMEVVVCENRVLGVIELLAMNPSINLILMDDGFQHRAIKPKLSLVVTPYKSPFFEDWLMPLGRLRESKNGINRADAVIVSKCQQAYKPFNWNEKPVFYAYTKYLNPEIKRPIYGFSGLGDNAPFKEFLTQNYELKGFSSFSDHHKYSQADMAELQKKANGALLVCTQKDEVKIRKYLDDDVCISIPIELAFFNETTFNQWIRSKI